jgi:hypothetical protein
MGMPCEVNSILKLGATAFPAALAVGDRHRVVKSGYRILPMDVPVQLVDADWLAVADVVIVALSWRERATELEFVIQRVYGEPFRVKG